jgi:glyoxylase-like metal-dependent hydrolase (beta-lactamase superfamily II)
MLEIKRYTFGPFQTNTYVVSGLTSHSENGLTSHILIIDPACYTPYEQQQLYRYIEKLSIINYQLSIIATHGHLDHLWGAKWATETWHTPVLINEADIPMVKAMQQQYDMFGVRATAEPFPIEPITNDQLPMTNVSILSTPGHTPGSICLYFPPSPITNNQSPLLISGDTLFQMGFGRTDLPGGNMGQLIESLERLFELPPDTVVYPGHGEMTTIGAERR